MTCKRSLKRDWTDSHHSHNNFLRTVRTFLRFAQKHGWLSKESDLLARVEQRTEKPTPVEIFTPAQLTTLFKHASPKFAPCVSAIVATNLAGAFI
jgi:hypothetical protein